MTWNRKGTWLINKKETNIPIKFTSRIISQVSNLSNTKPSWFWAGHLIQCLTIFPIGLVRIEDKIDVSIKDSSLFTPEIFKPNYQLKFYKADWIDSLRLTIYEDSMPVYNAQDTIVFPNTRYANSTATAIAPATISTSLLPANANRKNVVIANNTNQVMIIERGATASVPAATITLAAKTTGGLVSVWEDNDYTGVISAIAPVAATGSWNVREFT
jgi:hypothetical protein